jgi:AAA ATPase domain
MIGPTPVDSDEQLRHLRRFAALSGPFQPAVAFHTTPQLDVTETNRVATLSAQLANACDTRYQGEGHTWLMREPERRWELDELVPAGMDAAGAAKHVAEWVAWRRKWPTDEATNDLLDALLGAGFAAPEAVDTALRESGGRDQLERIAIALDRAGRHAPAASRLDAVKAALLELDASERDRILLDRGFVGRDAERAAIAAWIGNPFARPPIPALFITGLPGIGKSTLLEQAVLDAGSEHRWLSVRLDFDRAGLDVLDQLGLTMEASRQIAAQLGEHAAGLRAARLDAASAPPSAEKAYKGIDRERLPDPLVDALGRAIKKSGRSVLIVLDTLEVLRGRGQTHPRRLFEWLDRLCERGVAPMSVVAAGRGDAVDSVEDRIPERISLEGLTDGDADRMLVGFGIPASAFPSIRGIAHGNPLFLRLAAKLVNEAGGETLQKIAGKGELSSAYLYRFLLSRIDDEQLRELAHPGLVIRRISAEIIADVLAPQLGMGHLEPKVAKRLFDELASHHWLVEQDADAEFVRHRTDMRSVLLPLLYDDQPEDAAKIDEAASIWFAQRSEELDWCRIESAYHRLQLMRRDPSVPTLDPAVLRRFDAATIAELPEAAQNVVHQSRGDRSMKFRGEPAERPGSKRADLDLDAAKELDALIERRDWEEGSYVYERSFAVSRFDASAPEADVARTFLWRSGRWWEAKRLLAERDRRTRNDRDLDDLPPAHALVRLEMRAEFSFARLVRFFESDLEWGTRPLKLANAGGPSALGNGALGFAMRAAHSAAWSGWSLDVDSVGAIVAIGTSRFGSGPKGDLLSDAQARLASTMTSGQVLKPDSPQAIARLFAVLTPYAIPLGVIVRSGDKRRSREALTGHLYRVQHGLMQVDRLPPRAARSWKPRLTSNSLEAFDELVSTGLLAEWAGSTVVSVADRDIRLIAQAAERWRRTVSGRWSYDAPRPLMTAYEETLVDATIDDRLGALADERDPSAAAELQLAVWSGLDDPLTARLNLEQRYQTTIRRARSAGSATPTDIARELLRRNVPSAFVPALATLAARRRAPATKA